jgi:hypothetical protein
METKRKIIIAASVGAVLLIGYGMQQSTDAAPAAVSVTAPTTTTAATTVNVVPKQPIADLSGKRLREAIAVITSAGWPSSAIVDSAGASLADAYTRYEDPVAYWMIYGDQVMLTLTTPVVAYEPPAPSIITYKVYGAKRASVTYSTEGFGQEQNTSAKLPWSHDVQEVDYPTLIAQNAGGGTITCEILRDGVSISKQTSTGSYAVVSCS